MHAEDLGESKYTFETPFCGHDAAGRDHLHRHHFALQGDELAALPHLSILLLVCIPNNGSDNINGGEQHGAPAMFLAEVVGEPHK